MDPSYQNWVSDAPVQPVQGYQNIDSSKSYRLLRAANVKTGTYIIRPSSSAQSPTCTIDVKVDKVESYRLHKNNNVYSFTKRGQEVISANCFTDLMKKILLQNKWEPYIFPTLIDLV